MKNDMMEIAYHTTHESERFEELDLAHIEVGRALLHLGVSIKALLSWSRDKDPFPRREGLTQLFAQIGAEYRRYEDLPGFRAYESPFRSAADFPASLQEQGASEA